DELQQLLAREDLAVRLDEELEDRELLRREVRDLALHHDLVPLEIDVDVADRSLLLRVPAGGVRRAAKVARDARLELAQGKRLDDVVVGAELEAEYPVHLAALGREQQDRNVDLGPHHLKEL